MFLCITLHIDLKHSAVLDTKRRSARLTEKCMLMWPLAGENAREDGMSRK